MSSKLIAETPKSLIIEAYIHGNNDEWDDWQLDANGDEIFPGTSANWHHMLDEWTLTLEIDKNTGELIKVISVE